MTIEKDNIDNAISKGVGKFKEANPYPANLHARIMDKLEAKKAPGFRLSFVPRAALVIACLLVAVFIGFKMLESSRLQPTGQIPVAVVLSLESQASLIKTDTGSAFEDSINSAISNMQESGS